MVQNIQKDTAGRNPTTQHYGLEYIENIKENNNMTDIWRKQNPQKKEYTYFNNLADFKSRIDRFYLTSELENNYKIKTQIIQNYLSDHRMITLNFYPKHEKKRGPSYWKLNSSILQNKDYKNKITSFWHEWQQKKQKYRDLTIWWDNGKKFIQGITKDFCTKLKETEKEHLHQLRTELQTLQIQKNKDQIKINTIEGEIEEIESYQRKGAMVRSRTKLIENEEKPTKFFYAAEKQNQNKKTITKLKN